MPNPILRVGPFINSNVFVDQPSDLSAPGFARPINCANTTSSSRWPWRYNEGVQKIQITHTGAGLEAEGTEDERSIPTTGGSGTTETNNILTATGNFSKSVSQTSNYLAAVQISFNFFYQAAQSFQIKVDFTASASASSGLPTGSTFFEAAEIFNMNFSDGLSAATAAFPNLSGSVTRTLPAAVVPASYECILQSSSGIDFPDDFSIPNSGTATATASLNFQFL